MGFTSHRLSLWIWKINKSLVSFIPFILDLFNCLFETESQNGLVSNLLCSWVRPWICNLPAFHVQMLRLKMNIIMFYFYDIRENTKVIVYNRQVFHPLILSQIYSPFFKFCFRLKGHILNLMMYNKYMHHFYEDK